MFKTGLICRKTSGKDNGKICIVLESEKDKSFVFVEGEVKRKKYNIAHLEPVGYAEIDKDAPHDEVLKVIEAAGFKIKKNKNNILRKKFIKKQKNEDGTRSRK